MCPLFQRAQDCLSHLVAFLVLAATLAAQEPPPQFSARTDLVFLPTRVQTKKGETIYGLTRDQFVIEDNGVRQEINLEADPEVSGLSLVVAIQCGGSAPDEFVKLKGLATMIEAITGGTPHEVAVITFSAEPILLGDFTSNSDAMRRAVGRLKDCNGYRSASIDAVQYSINLLKKRKNRYRKVILLVGETRDHGSKAKLSDVVGELGITDTVIYSVAFSPAKNEVLWDLKHSNDAYYEDDSPPPPKKKPPADPVPDDPPPQPMTSAERPPRNPLPPEIMLLVNALRKNAASELAVLSGGEYTNFTTQKGFEQSLQRISNEIHNYYLLSFKPSNTAYGLHTLKVRVPDHPDALIQTRKNYWAGMVEPQH